MVIKTHFSTNPDTLINGIDKNTQSQGNTVHLMLRAAGRNGFTRDH